MQGYFAIICQKVLANCSKCLYNDRVILCNKHLCNFYKEAGTMAKLRLMESEGMHYWLVENAGDFEQLDVKVLVNVNMCADYQSGGLKLLDEPKSFHLGGVIGDGSYSSMENNSDYGTDAGRLSRFYGSKRLRQLYDKSPDTGSIYFLIDGENEDYIDDIQ